MHILVDLRRPKGHERNFGKGLSSPEVGKSHIGVPIPSENEVFCRKQDVGNDSARHTLPIPSLLFR